MERIVVDSELPSKLPAVMRPVELCDPAGRILGTYTPELDDVEPPIAEEELRRRENEPGGRSLREILADLENRG